MTKLHVEEITISVATSIVSSELLRLLSPQSRTSSSETSTVIAEHRIPCKAFVHSIQQSIIRHSAIWVKVIRPRPHQRTKRTIPLNRDMPRGARPPVVSFTRLPGLKDNPKLLDHHQGSTRSVMPLRVCYLTRLFQSWAKSRRTTREVLCQSLSKDRLPLLHQLWPQCPRMSS